MKKTVFAYLRILLSILLILPASAGTQAKELVVNGGFETRRLGGAPPKNYFINVHPDPWTITTAPGSSLAFIGAPGTADNGAYMSVYGPFPTSSGPGTSGGNFLYSDGDPRYSGLIEQTINLPKAGDYVVSFRQAAGQQDDPDYDTPTTEWWDVTLGSAPTQSSPVFNLVGPFGPGAPAANVGQWQSVSMTFKNLAAGPAILSFLARGTPSGEPPICFLDSVSVPGVPEPGSLLLVGLGLLVSVGFARIRRKSGQGVSDN